MFNMKVFDNLGIESKFDNMLIILEGLMQYGEDLLLN